METSGCGIEKSRDKVDIGFSGVIWENDGLGQAWVMVEWGWVGLVCGESEVGWRLSGLGRG